MKGNITFNDEHEVIDMGTGSESESGDQNPSSPVLVVSATVERRKKNRKRKERTSQGQDKAIQAARERLAESKSKSARRARSRSSSADDIPDDIPDATPPKKGQKKTSIVWNHCTKKKIGGKDVTKCNYCPNSG